MVRVAVAHGVRPEDALVMASWNPAQFHRLDGLGAIAPGFQADVVVLDDLVRFEPRLGLKRGAEPVFGAVAGAGWARRTVRSAPLRPDAFQVPAGGGRARAIRVIPGQLLTAEEAVEGRVAGDCLEAAPERDLAKIAVVERHHATGRVGAAFVTGTGLREG